MPIDYQAHYQALYDAMRSALDSGDHSAVPLLHTTSQDSQTGEHQAAPFVIYRQDIERNLGTTGRGDLVVMRSGWVITSFSEELHEGLDLVSAIANRLAADGGVADTADGYTTTGFEVLGVQSLYEVDFRVYATHLRATWERSL